MDGWVEVKAVLRIAYSNQKLKLLSKNDLQQSKIKIGVQK
jgi:hypothetical protein